ncbi:similar to Saccharomyces cerevisiae YDR410C STE14 Farnesyl cysteine-carboxyl methyltransferase [Maudiozyma saulgeensis]|uniref:Protein-S-isoprenylcysteine O-methyltransferase n=1 Tax=Maudiozyma saulgeensis TaxID=1789683 RepID=A0A1X7R1R9_9SACH|nr:similar to Saccharomyces cerevisiae YDR410C STE14 Farnesyl cysteine-carboxyl methyltransferase [Kazachstania saulgeensis]
MDSPSPVPDDYSNESSSESDHPINIDDKPCADITKNEPDLISLTSFLLGIVFGLFVGLIPTLKFKGINFYIIALTLFHFLEYYITAKYNPRKVHSDSFLLFGNGKEYIGAHTFALLECLVEYIIWPESKKTTGIQHYVAIIGMILTIIGQHIRTTAMKTAAQSFSHILKRKKERDHTLVTTGLYAYFRHPSYFGFFWWTIGLQLVLFNPLSSLIFTLVLWRFFSKRIKVEEEYLISFFGNDYINYKKNTKVWIPFIQ